MARTADVARYGPFGYRIPDEPDRSKETYEDFCKRIDAGLEGYARRILRTIQRRQQDFAIVIQPLPAPRRTREKKCRK